ncbi:hypothetical protein ABZ884_28035, partial [Streptomyces sp. NPDC046942]
MVEVPVTVDAHDAHPLTITRPELHQAGLMQQVTAVERLTISATVTGDRADALKGFAFHPSAIRSRSAAGCRTGTSSASRTEVAAVFGGGRSRPYGVRGDGARYPRPTPPADVPSHPFQNGRPSVEVVIVPDAAAGGELIAEAMAQLLR